MALACLVTDGSMMLLEKSQTTWSRLSEPSRALLRSHGGLPFSCCPVSPTSRFSSQEFRVLSYFVPSGFPPLSVDAFGHRCATIGVLGRRGFSLESAAAHVCREASGRVSVNVFVSDLDIAILGVMDNIRLEVVADGLPLFHGAQLAVDTTIVSALKRDGSACRRSVTVDGASLTRPRQRKKRRIQNWQDDLVAPAWSCWFVEVGGRWSEECQDFLRQLAMESRSTGMVEALELLLGVQRSDSVRLERRVALGSEGPTLLRPKWRLTPGTSLSLVESSLVAGSASDRPTGWLLIFF